MGESSESSSATDRARTVLNLHLVLTQAHGQAVRWGYERRSKTRTPDPVGRNGRKREHSWSPWDRGRVDLTDRGRELAPVRRSLDDYDESARA